MTHVVDLHESCRLSDDVSRQLYGQINEILQVHDYPLVCLGKVTVESIDDKEEMQIMDEAFDILGCPYQEKMDIYRVSALCMQLGRMEFQGMGEVASPKNIDAAADINGMCVCLYFYFYHNIQHQCFIMTMAIFRCGYSDNEELIYDCFINPKYKVILFLVFHQFLLPCIDLLPAATGGD